MASPILLAVPNVSEGRDRQAIAALAGAFAQQGRDLGSQAREQGTPDSRAGGVRLLDVHSDRDHHRSVFTLAGPPGRLGDALLEGARAALELIDVVGRPDAELSEIGQHPHVGALDVVPVVYLDEAARGAACAQALVVADRIGEELEVPVFLYGELTADDPGSSRTRAELRRGGVRALAARMAGAGGPTRAPSPTAAIVAVAQPLVPDFGPPRLHPTAGATLLAARAPLVAFNVQLAAPATLADARRIAALVREGGHEGLPGVRAIGVQLEGEVAQVSMNVERPFDVPLVKVLEAVGRHLTVDSVELVGLAPRAALEGFPEGMPMPGFDPARHVIENALGC